MKRLHYCLLFILPLVLACGRKEYDISEGFNKDITLFQEGISVPLGSIGPLTLGSVLDMLFQIEDLGPMLAEYLIEGEDGYMKMVDSDNIFKLNVYEMEKELEDPSVPSVYDAGYQSGFIGGLAGTVGFFGLQALNQQVSFTAINPLRDKVPVSCTAEYTCSDLTNMITGPIDVLESFTIPRSRDIFTVGSFSIPEDVKLPLSYMSLEDVMLSLPSNPTERIYNNTGNVFFSLDYDFTCTLGVAESFKFPLVDISVGSVNLEIGKYNLSKCNLTVELENTIPMRIAISNVRALKEDGETVNTDIQITSDVVIAGGSFDRPATSQMTLAIESASGTIPDIHGFKVDLELSGEPGLENTAMSARQGFYVKSSSATLSGGITIPLNK
ncbi:MAG: hypothetical protein J5519_08200 [Bacteroidales bacterium]|nr:hypothetical protein [Bacteroidales bacterium]